MRLLGDKGRSNVDNTRMLFKLLCLRSETVECVCVCMCVCLSVCLYVCLSVCLSVGSCVC